MNHNKFIHTFFICIFLFSCTGCIDDSDSNALSKESLKAASSADDYDIATANNAFAFDMYDNIKTDANTIFSPYSIFTAMAICYDGSGGSTQEQLSDVFYYPLDKQVLEQSSQDMIATINSGNDQYALNTANALWVQENYTLKSQYVYNAQTYYDGKVESMDFVGETDKSRLIINNWIENKTNNKIVNLLTEGTITPGTKLVITNAVYFNGTWMTEFEEAATRNKPFTLSNGQVKDVDTMYIDGRFNYTEDESASMLELPYKGDDITMYVVLPAENNIREFESSFTLDEYNMLKGNMNKDNVLEIWMPKYTYETKARLNEPLQDMGAVDAFHSGIADFSGISDTGLSISDVFHQAYIGVNEKGTEATAATGVVMLTSGIVSDIQLHFDRPFLFFIEDRRNGCILFMGKVEDPSASS